MERLRDDSRRSIRSDVPSYLVRKPIAIGGCKTSSTGTDNQVGLLREEWGAIDENTLPRPIIQPARAEESTQHCRDI